MDLHLTSAALNGLSCTSGKPLYRFSSTVSLSWLPPLCDLTAPVHACGAEPRQCPVITCAYDCEQLKHKDLFHLFLCLLLIALGLAHEARSSNFTDIYWEPTMGWHFKMQIFQRSTGVSLWKEFWDKQMKPRKGCVLSSFYNAWERKILGIEFNSPDTLFF